MHPSTLWRIFRESCGDTWSIRLGGKTITYQVPRLLDNDTIRRVNDKLDANATNGRGSPKYDYLLNGHIFCAACEATLSGSAKKQGKYLYYRHLKNTAKAKACPLWLGPHRPYVHADEIEPKIVRQLFDMIGNPAEVERAVKRAMPDCERQQKELKRLENELAGIERGRQRILAMVARDLITDAQAEKQVAELKDRETNLLQERDRLASALAAVATAEQIKEAVDFFEVNGRLMFCTRYPDGVVTCSGGIGSYMAMVSKPEDQRHLIETFFADPLPDGKPAGVYVSCGHYELRGMLATAYGLGDSGAFSLQRP
jgi:hypothetical protein